MHFFVNLFDFYIFSFIHIFLLNINAGDACKRIRNEFHGPSAEHLGAWHVAAMHHTNACHRV